MMRIRQQLENLEKAVLSDGNSGQPGTLLGRGAFFVLSLIVLMLVGKLLFMPADASGLLVAIVIIAGLVLVAPRILDLYTGSNKGSWRGELQHIDRKLDTVSRKIDELYLLTMSAQLFETLKHLASEAGFKEYEMTESLRWELRHLRGIGYIEVYSVGNIPPNGKNLSEYVRVTPAGKRFVGMREAMQRLTIENVDAVQVSA